MLLASGRAAWYGFGMTISELGLSPRGSGRASRPLTAVYVRDLQPADVSLLASERGIKPTPIARLRDRHHSLARCLAQGMKDAEASAVTGYDVSRISILKSDPTFKELVDHYQRQENSLLADFTERATSLSLTALNEIQERIEEDAESVSMTTLLEVVKITADRTGHAPVSKSLNVNINADLGSRMEAAKRRLREARATDAEFKLVSPSDGG